METKTSDACIVADPAICHGEPTFRGTRILVADVLAPAASGMAWEAIIDSGVTRVTSDAIAEAVRMVREAPAAYVPKLVSEPVIT